MNPPNVNLWRMFKGETPPPDAYHVRVQTLAEPGSPACDIWGGEDFPGAWADVESAARASLEPGTARALKVAFLAPGVSGYAGVGHRTVFVPPPRAAFSPHVPSGGAPTVALPHPRSNPTQEQLIAEIGSMLRESLGHVRESQREQGDLIRAAFNGMIALTAENTKTVVGAATARADAAHAIAENAAASREVALDREAAMMRELVQFATDARASAATVAVAQRAPGPMDAVMGALLARAQEELIPVLVEKVVGAIGSAMSGGGEGGGFEAFEKIAEAAGGLISMGKGD